MLYYFAAVLYVLACLSMIGVILLQQGKGGDMAAAFGGGSSQAAFGARSGATVLTRATTVLAVLFLVGALALNILAQRGPGSVVGGRAPQGAPATTTIPTPAQAAPTAPPAPAAQQPPVGASPATAPPAPGTAPGQ